MSEAQRRTADPHVLELEPVARVILDLRLTVTEHHQEPERMVRLDVIEVVIEELAKQGSGDNEIPAGPQSIEIFVHEPYEVRRRKMLYDMRHEDCIKAACVGGELLRSEAVETGVAIRADDVRVHLDARRTVAHRP